MAGIKKQKKLGTLLAIAVVAIFGLVYVNNASASPANGADIKIVNNTSVDMYHQSTETNYGNWAHAPRGINAHGGGEIFTIHGGALTGAEGTITYSLGQTDRLVKIYFDNSLWTNSKPSKCTLVNVKWDYPLVKCKVETKWNDESVGKRLRLDVTVSY